MNHFGSIPRLSDPRSIKSDLDLSQKVLGDDFPEMALIEWFDGILGHPGHHRNSLGHEGVLQIDSGTSWIHICKNPVTTLDTLINGRV